MEIHPSKWAASILNMEPPKTLKEVQSDSGTDSWQSALLPNDEEEGPRSIWQAESLASPTRISRPLESHCILGSQRDCGECCSRERRRRGKAVYFLSLGPFWIPSLLRCRDEVPTNRESCFRTAARKRKPYWQSGTNKLTFEKSFGPPRSGRLLTWALELSEFDITQEGQAQEIMEKGIYLTHAHQTPHENFAFEA